MLTAKDLVDARLYASEQEVLDDALRRLLRSRPELRVRLAIHRYESGPISLAKAAAIAGVSWAQMRDILLEGGVTLRLGPENLDEARGEVEALRRQLDAAL